MIEAFWRSLKHSWLYLHSLESVESLRRLVDFYVRQHNEVMPHAAFEGQTPDEIYFGRRDAVVVMLVAARIKAREERIKANRTAVETQQAEIPKPFRGYSDRFPVIRNRELVSTSREIPASETRSPS